MEVEGRGAFVRDLSTLPSRAGDDARREAREWVEGFVDFLSFAVLAIVGTVCGVNGDGWVLVENFVGLSCS